MEVSLFRFLSEKFESVGRISVERVVSGTGLVNVYEFLVHAFPDRVDAAVQREYLDTKKDDRARVVAVHATADAKAPDAASKKEKSLCYEAMQIMMNAYGCEVGSAAIKWIPTGGLFVTGGLLPCCRFLTVVGLI